VNIVGCNQVITNADLSDVSAGAVEYTDESDVRKVRTKVEVSGDVPPYGYTATFAIGFESTILSRPACKVYPEGFPRPFQHTTRFVFATVPRNSVEVSVKLVLCQVPPLIGSTLNVGIDGKLENSGIVNL
jgi:hypothetical protein